MWPTRKTQLRLQRLTYGTRKIVLVARLYHAAAPPPPASNRWRVLAACLCSAAASSALILQSRWLGRGRASTERVSDGRTPVAWASGEHQTGKHRTRGRRVRAGRAGERAPEATQQVGEHRKGDPMRRPSGGWQPRAGRSGLIADTLKRENTVMMFLSALCPLTARGLECG
jgi:hypothetical protein